MKNATVAFGAFLVAAASAPWSASADELSMRMYGHQVAIARDAKDMLDLTVDGRTVVRDAVVAIDETAVVGGVPVLIGERGQGGNACDTQRFVVALPTDAKAGARPRIDGPIETCDSTTYRVLADSIVVERPPSPSGEGKRWTWTPDRGFSKVEVIPFVPSDRSGWAALRAHALDHPGKLFGYADLAGLIRDRLPQGVRDQIPELLKGPGQVRYDGDVAVAFVCRSHACDESGMLIALDSSARKISIAFKAEGGGAAFVAPPFGRWPAEAAEEIAHFRDVYREDR